MAEDGFYLNDEEGRLLRQMMDEFRRRSNRRPPNEPPDVPTSTDIFLAKAPAAGIPARSGATPPIPGEAVCDLWRINASRELVVTADGNGAPYQKTVQNWFPVVIGDNTLSPNMVVARLKSGHYIVLVDYCG